MNKVKEFIEISNKKLNVGLIMLVYKEDGDFISYSPSLNICGQGGTEEEAKQSFEIILDEFFQYTLNKKTLSDVLNELGWKNTKQKKYSKPFDYKATEHKNIPYELLPYNKNILQHKYPSVN